MGGNSLFSRAVQFNSALQFEALPRPPVWIMRQAGRYLTEYNEVKAKHSFLEICRTPELAVQVSLQPIHYLNVDAAIIFSDILIPVVALGIEVDFNPGPIIKNPIRTGADLASLKRIGEVTTQTAFLPKAISSLKNELRSLPGDPKALLGFAGAPWTMACYIIEQKPFKHFERTQIVAREERAQLHRLLELLTSITEEYLLAQVEAGADAIQLFDTWAGNLSLADYREFALPYTQRIFATLEKRGVPTILYINGCTPLLPGMIESGAKVLSLDWRIDLEQALRLIPSEIAVQGNLDPTLLYGTPESVKQQTELMLRAVNKRPGYIANLGHGILQTTPRENALSFVKTVQAGWP